MRSLDGSEKLLQSVDEIYRALSHGSEPSVDTVHRLSQQLLSGLGPTLRQVDHVHIAPDQRLFYLPFEILRSPASNDALVNDVTVSYLPSGAALGWLHHDRENAPLSLIGVGDPPLEPADRERSAPADLLVRRFNLGQLPAAADELKRIASWIDGPTAIRTGAAATEEELGRLAAGGSNIVHLVSHTIVDERPGRGAAILLSPGETSDGLLYPEEIAAMSFPVDLTVLAACRTAVGGARQNDALATLTGAFLAAGSSAVVATLWDVGDDATAAFMEQFYFQIHRGHSAADALRNAKLRMIRDPRWNDSSVWAAYILVGDVGRIATPPQSRWWWLAGLIVLMTGAIILRRRYGTTVN